MTLVPLEQALNSVNGVYRKFVAGLNLFLRQNQLILAVYGV